MMKKCVISAKEFDSLGLPKTKTTRGLRLHLVKGESVVNAAAKVDMSFQVLYRALRDLPARRCPTCGAIRSLTPLSREAQDAKA